jgi:hypothetical protein
MPKNHYFGHSIPSEQRLIEDLVTEAISIYGVPAYWLPRQGTTDQVYGESTDRHFDQAYLLSEQVHLESSMSRPMEGDLIYFDLTDPNSAANKQGTFMEINFVEHESVFYQVGALQMYEIRCEDFRYSQETFSTGIINIDQSFNANTSEYNFTGNTMPDSTLAGGAENETFETDGAAILDLSEDSPFGDFS